MKVVTLNLRQGGGSRISLLIDYLLSLKADVLVLSEFRENVSAQILRSKLGDAGLVHFAAAPTTSPRQKGVCIFSRCQFLPRTYSKILTTDSHRVVSAHFGSSSIYGVYFPQKLAKAPLFRFFLDSKYKPANAEVIVMGDFNTGLHGLDEKGSSFYCADLFSLLPEAGLIDSWRSRNRNAKMFSWFSNVGDEFRVDHVFANPSADCRIKEVYYDHAPRENGFTDHSAMVVEYCMNEFPDMTGLDESERETTSPKSP